MASQLPWSAGQLCLCCLKAAAHTSNRSSTLCASCSRSANLACCAADRGAASCFPLAKSAGNVSGSSFDDVCLLLPLRPRFPDLMVTCLVLAGSLTEALSRYWSYNRQRSHLQVFSLSILLLVHDGWKQWPNVTYLRAAGPLKSDTLCSYPAIVSRAKPASTTGSIERPPPCYVRCFKCIVHMCQVHLDSVLARWLELLLIFRQLSSRTPKEAGAAI